MPTLDALIDAYAERIADTPAARAALRTIFEAAVVDSDPPALPPAVADAYRTLNRESGIQARNDALSTGLLVTRRSVDLAREEQPGNTVCLER